MMHQTMKQQSESTIVWRRFLNPGDAIVEDLRVNFDLFTRACYAAASAFEDDLRPILLQMKRDGLLRAHRRPRGLYRFRGHTA